MVIPWSQNAEQLKEQVCGKKRSNLAIVVRWRHLYQIAPNQVESFEAAHQIQNLRAREAANLRSARARGKGRIDDVNVESEVNRSITELLQVPLNERNSLPMKLLRSDDLDMVVAREVEVFIRIHLPAQSNLECVPFGNESFFYGILHRGSMRMRAPEVATPRVSVGVELNECNRSELPVNCAEDRQQDRVIASDADGSRLGVENVYQLAGDALVRVLDGERINRQITKVSDSPFGEWIDLQDRIPWPDHGGLDSNVSRAKTWTGAVGGATVKGNSDHGDIQVLGARDVWQAHECGNARETRVDQGIDWLRMRFGALFGFHAMPRIIEHWKGPITRGSRSFPCPAARRNSQGFHRAHGSIEIKFQ